MTRALFRFALSSLFAIAALGCGGPDPRYGEATLSEGAPRLTQSGTTFGQAPALELAPGCPGYLDAEQPGHIIHVDHDLGFTLQARSSDGPVALAVASADEVRCDSDEGAGHAPSLRFEGAGDYQVYVAALRAPAELAYELSVFAEGAEPTTIAAAAGSQDVSVTITSEPSGAQVTAPGGEILGTTPAMFMLSVPAGELGQPRVFRLTLEEHEPVDVSGVLRAGAMALHGQLSRVGPTEVEVTSDEATPIRDYHTAALAVEVAEQCAITDATVEVDIQHGFVGDLRVELQTPWQETLTLQRHRGGSRRNLRRSWTTSDLRPLVSRSTRGRWTLLVHDDAGADEGSLERFTLQLRCDPQGTQPEVETPEVVSERPPRRPPPARNPQPPRVSRLPDLPTRAEIVRVLGGQRARAEACSTQGGQVRVMATVNGSSGRVTSVSSSGTASTAERTCVQRIVRSARFNRFRRQSVDIDYTYDLPRRAATPQTVQGGQVISPWN